MPGIEDDLDSSDTGFLLKYLKPEVQDVIIIGTADNAVSTEIGARSAALELLKKTT